ncbi:hypothetical protein EWM64_g5164 [Hericium alpestre]|uniref:Uncharacterized protein n=1 Tax=Hericium alpestre TaxID=135208 RepID=A0A4Y9ZY42_9AGAM|nr:hypothetical protein EWM64_g5164 [Hericium alpestre]
MGAWSVDMIGHIECFDLNGETTPTKNGAMSARAYCYEFKVLEAFSWMIFVLLTFFLIFVIQLANQSQIMGRPFIWREDINDLPWFGQAPGYPGVPYGQQVYPYGYGYPQMYPGAMNGGTMNGGMLGPGHYQQQAGYSVVIQPGINGQPAQVTQIPGHVSTGMM